MYRCVITDGDGNTVTSSAKSIIATDLAITKQPGTFKGLLGDTVTLSVNVYGSNLSYRWQVSTDGGESWSNSSAEGHNTKTISGFELTEARNGNMYRCIVTDGDGNTVTSNAGKISVITETWQYTYDADGLRTKATNGHNTYEYTYDGGKLTSMVVNGEDVFYFFYDGNGKPMLFMYNGIKYFYATNLQGDVTAIVSVSGVIKAEYAYDAWGNILSITGTNAATLGKLNPLRYRGYVYDQPTGQYYLQSRYYDPNLGRFINADAFASTGQGLLGNNMFAYCGNNPVNLIDPYGLCGIGVSQRFSSEVTNCLFGCMAGMALVGGAIAAGVIIGSSLADVFEETAEKIITWVETQAAQAKQRDNSVYVLKDPNDGNLVKYVGRTNDPSRRLYEHQHDSVHPWRKNYTMTVVATGLTKDEAMLFEQTLISAYTLNYLENARREVAKNNIGKFLDYVEAVAEILSGLPASDIRKFLLGR